MKKRIRRKWTSYIHKNKAGQDCQLVSVVNAYHYLTGKTISEKLYDELVGECGCRHGSCINMSKALDRLGICEGERFKTLGSFPDLVPKLPLEINVWHKFFGFHVILAVEWSSRLRAYRVTNFRHVASSLGWIFEEDLTHYVILNANLDDPRWRSRTFKIVNSGRH